MPADIESDPKLEIGHVLAMDIIGYSKLLIHEQSDCLKRLNNIVRGTDHLRMADANEKLIRLPTGDGMVLVFLEDPKAPIECAMEISTALKRQPEIQLRMGIHSGPINEVLDVNERRNVAGAGIDIAQRVMDCGDAGHILLSKRVADDLAPYSRWNPHLHDLGECEVKHGRKISLVNFYTKEIGNAKRPTRCSAPRDQPLPQKTVSAPTPATAKSIAVLPFENLSHDPDNAYFADGVQEEILMRLSRIRDLKVVSRTSTQRYRSAPTNLREIVEQLGVAHILEGSVQKAGDQVRVHVQLINAQTDSHLWADKFDRKLTDIFAVESEIAAKIADILQAKLTDAEEKALVARPTENSEAHQLYLKGRFYWNKWLAPGFEKSRDYYQQAIELDPSYALAYAGLADYYGFAFANGLLPPEEKWAKAEEDAANKALELDPTLGEAYNPLAAAMLYYHRDWSAAQRYFQRGIELSPNFAEMRHHFALCLVLFGRNDEALVEMRRGIELDPLSLRFNWNWARLLFFMGLFDQAISQFHKTLELDSNHVAAREWLGYAYERKGMNKEAITEWVKALVLTGDSELAGVLERTYQNSGFGAALAALAEKQLERLEAKTGCGGYVPAVEYVTAYMRRGNKDQAFVWLAKAVEERNRFALEFKVNPVFDPLRSDPRFDGLITQIRVR